DHWFLGRLTEGSDVSARFLTKLSQAFPELNLEWILTGKGPMVQGAAPTQRSLPQELLHIEEAFRHITSKEILISDSAKAKAFEQLVELMTDLVSFLSLAQARRLDSQLAFLEIIEPKLSDS
ncbi:MAG TPA: hypothetical protein DCP28_08120, partial [Cytophagales bacterium]|nr:hypothetical protein [Cytophagales bacterium]